jgi:hypothetical protein
MADIVQSLFGVTPELYQQAQAQRASEQALQYAQLSPFQQANYAIGRGGYQLAGALGGTDPQLQMISTRNSIAKQINYNDPNSIMGGVQMLSQAGDTVGAMQLADVARKMESEMALRQQRGASATASLAQAAKDQQDIENTKSQYAAFERLYPTAAAPAAAPSADPLGDFMQQQLAASEARQSGTPAAPSQVPTPPAQTRGTLTQQISDLEKQQAALLSLPKVPAAKAQADVLGERIKDLRSQLKPTDIATLEREIAQLQAEGATDTDPRVKNRLSKIEKLVSGAAERFGVDREAAARELFFKPFSELTQAEVAAANALVEARQNTKAKSGATQFQLPGDKQLADIPKFRRDVQATIDPQLKAINSSDQALQAINDSMKTGNFAAYRAAQTQFARAISGAGDLSQKELKAAGADPSLLGGAADYLSTLFTSTPTADTQKKIRDTLNAIRTVAARKATAEVDAQRAIALGSPGYDAAAVNRALNFSELAAPAVPIPAGGGSLADQAKAELARRRGTQ